MPVTHFGGVVYSNERFNFFRQENWHCINAGEASILNVTSLPWGVRNPICWRLAMKNGAISSNTKIVGSSTVTGTGNYGKAILANLQASGGISSALANIGMELLATLSGSGEVSSAVGLLLAQISATLEASGGIVSPPILAYLNALATITGTGEISDGDLKGLGALLSVLAGEGIIQSTLTATGELAAEIKSYGTLSPEGIRDAVWNAVAASFNETGSMGNKMNSAASAGDPWGTLLPGTYGDGEAGKILSQIQTLVDELHKIEGLSEGNPMVVTQSNRTAGTINLDITGDGENQTIVTRND